MQDNKRFILYAIVLATLSYLLLWFYPNNKTTKIFKIPLNNLDCSEAVLVRDFDSNHPNKLDELVKERYNIIKQQCPTFYVECYHETNILDTTFMFLNDRRWDERESSAHFRQYYFSNGKLVFIFIYDSNGNVDYSIRINK